MIPLITPPTKIAKVVVRGRYIPTLTSIGLFTFIRMNPTPMNIPTMISGQAISPPTIPRERMAIKLAWGAGRLSLPKPPTYPCLFTQSNVSVIQNGKNEKHHSTRSNHANDVTNLHFPGGTAENVP
jgi:hypothetical protein